jgi:hypothetical protein
MSNRIIGGKISVKNLKGILKASYDTTEPTGDFVLDTQISSGTSKVFYDPKTGQAVVAHRGTEGASDWLNNAVYGVFGKWGYQKTNRFKEAERIQKLAQKKYGAKNVSTVAHSQGGLQAELLGQKSREIITLNKATRIGSNSKGSNEYDIRSSGDIVSALNPLEKENKKEIVIPKQSNNPLVEHSIDILDRLPEDQLIGEGRKKMVLHAVVIHKTIPLVKAREIAQQFIKDKKKKFMREETNTYRFRNIPKTKLKGFKSHKVNDDITLVFGLLK